jgi:hypothetical protein
MNKRLVVCILVLLVSCGAPPASTPQPTIAPLPPITPVPTRTPAPTLTPAPTSTLPPATTVRSAPSATPATAEGIIAGRAGEVILAIKNKDMEKLAGFAHPTQGVRFSPYAYVQKTDRVLTAAQIKTAWTDSAQYLWGAYDGSGLAIKLAFQGYYKQFIYSHDFARAEQIGYDRRIGSGTTRDNSAEFYPGAIVVEYHFPGFDTKFQGMDWESLRLVFQKEGQVWYLVGVIHAQWTT